MPLSCEISKRSRGTLNKINWRRHIDSCKIKNSKKNKSLRLQRFFYSHLFFQKKKENCKNHSFRYLYVTENV